MARHTKESQIIQLRKQLEDAYAEISKLKKEAEEGFKGSPLYNEMSDKLRFYEASEKMDLLRLEYNFKREAETARLIKELKEDNKAFCAANGAEYWEGISEIDRWDAKRIQNLEEELRKQQAKVEARDLTIKHLKKIIAGQENPEIPHAPAKKVGKPPIPEKTKKRIRNYRLEGYKIKEIAEMEGLSLGAVSNVCSGIKQNNHKK